MVYDCCGIRPRGLVAPGDPRSCLLLDQVDQGFLLLVGKFKAFFDLQLQYFLWGIKFFEYLPISGGDGLVEDLPLFGPELCGFYLQVEDPGFSALYLCLQFDVQALESLYPSGLVDAGSHENREVVVDVVLHDPEVVLGHAVGEVAVKAEELLQ